MNFDEFSYRVKKATQEYMGEGAEILVEKITKNNGLELTGLFVRGKAGEATPTVYLEQFFDAYNKGMAFGEVMQKIFTIYEEYDKVQIDLDFFLDYEKIKGRLLCKLVHYEKNRELLKQVPYIPWEDLAIVFFVLLDNDTLGRGTIVIKNEHMEKWHVSVEEMYRDAMENMPRMMEEELLSMQQLLTESGYPCPGAESGEENPLPMFVLTNKHRMYGAAALMYTRKLRELAGRLNTNVFIIPSSVHEVILMPDQGQEEAADIMDLIKLVNQTQVAPDEVLSDALYYYDKVQDKIGLFC